ncbi:MAG: SLC13 family permease [Candidatus Omnitrophica bacterium]|nr:SLC13 family permease [Candidatus Omnitrophota bacterium]
MIKSLVLAIFFLAYLGLVFRRSEQLYFVYAAVIVYLALGVLGWSDLFSSLNYNVLGVFLGTSFVSRLFSDSRVPAWLVEKIEQKQYPAGLVYLLICLITSLVSILIENVATLMIMAPVAFSYTRKRNLNPVPLVIGMAISSNLQGCATMVGDSPSLILAMETGLRFTDFFYLPARILGSFSGRPGLFFFVEISAFFSFLVLYSFFRRYRQRFPPAERKITVSSWVPTYLLSFMVLALAVSSFFYQHFSYFPLASCLTTAVAGAIWQRYHDRQKLRLTEIDWQSFFLLVGIFILVGALRKAGLIDELAYRLATVGQRQPFLLYLMVVWLSVLVSALVDNIPYTMAMIGTIKILANQSGLNPFPYLFGLLLGTCLGGNITPVGASCNLVAVGLLRQEGFPVRFGQFMRLGLPFTLTAVLVGSLLLWLVYPH